MIKGERGEVQPLKELREKGEEQPTASMRTKSQLIPCIQVRALTCQVFSKKSLQPLLQRMKVM